MRLRALSPISCYRLSLILLFVIAGLQPICAQTRLDRDSPGLVVETGARTTNCDELLWSSDGSKLQAAGDDKVVRTWEIGQTQFLTRRSSTFRWPTLREQLGCIYAMAPSPDGKSIAIAGCGKLVGLVAVLDRKDGTIRHVMSKPSSDQVTWSLAWSPDGKWVVIGNERGQLFRWEPGASVEPESFPNQSENPTNAVRQIAFLNKEKFISVAQDCLIYEWNINKPKEEPTYLGSFSGRSLLRVRITKDRNWLAAISENVQGDLDEKGKEYGQVEVLDLKKLREKGAKAAGLRFTYTIPKLEGYTRVPTAIAFSPSGEYLAIGVQGRREIVNPKKESDFFNVTTGSVFVYSMKGVGPRLSKIGLNIGYRVDNIAFRPTNESQLATAGGPNHEVRLWDWKTEQLLDTIESPGSTIWKVAFSTNGRYLAWKDQLNSHPLHPNERADPKAPWRLFDLKNPKGGILSENEIPARFDAVESLRSYEPSTEEEKRIYGSWRIDTTANGYLWRLIGPTKTWLLNSRNKLFYWRQNQKPLCYTFIPPSREKPVVRLVIGHMWGASVYECKPGDVRFSRILVGHEGEVMSLGTSKDGKLLVTGSRDQTISCFSLVDWPFEPELGCSFVPQGKDLVVKNLAIGSPAWETGLSNGDRVHAIAISHREKQIGLDYRGEVLKEYGIQPSEEVSQVKILEELRKVEPYREHIFIWTNKDGKRIARKTTVKQRPLWRFFPTRATKGNEWVLWRWRDFYYDVGGSRPDQLVGWQFNPSDFKKKPAFYPLNSLGGALPGAGIARSENGFHRPVKVWAKVLEAFQEPEKVIVPDIEPPEVELTIVQSPNKDQDLKLNISAKPRNKSDDQKVVQAILMLDDYRLDKKLTIVKGAISETIDIDRKLLRNGTNRIRLICFNDRGARGEEELPLEFKDPTRLKPNLYAICVGINDYSKVKGFPGVIAPLNCARADAEIMVRIFEQHEKSDLFARAEVIPLFDQQATAARIRTEMEKLEKRVTPDDWVMIFMSGHGLVKRDENTNSIIPGSFAYVCANSDSNDINSMLQAEEISRKLERVKGRKVVFLDACHSGELSSPIRSLNRNGAEFFVFAASKANQSALEPTPQVAARKPYMRNGLFTQGLLAALENPNKVKKPRTRPVSAQELAVGVELKIRSLLAELNQGVTSQIPDYFPSEMPITPILCKPAK